MDFMDIIFAWASATTASAVGGPYCVEAGQVFSPTSDAGEVFAPGDMATQVFNPGGVTGQAVCE
jgi:hypothetical protein